MFTKTSGRLQLEKYVLRCREERTNSREERTNIHDPFAVTIIKDDSVVGHVPQKISTLCSSTTTKTMKFKFQTTIQKPRNFNPSKFSTLTVVYTGV